jgi:hypothetical protein
MPQTLFRSPAGFHIGHSALQPGSTLGEAFIFRHKGLISLFKKANHAKANF